MAYPRVVIDSEKIKSNVKFLVAKGEKQGVQLMGVTKVFSGEKEIARIFMEGGVKFLADSRLENLKNFKEFDIPKVLIRIPMKSQAKEIVKYSDISVNSEISIIETLNKEAEIQGKIHKIILMIELGDLREGILPTDIKVFLDQVVKFENIKLEGIAVNLTCYGGVIPTPTNLGRLEKIAIFIESEYKIKLNIISGGNSSSMKLLLDNKLPEKINNLRLGEALIFGRETAYGEFLDNCFTDAVYLETEIIELKEKYSYPIGKIGVNVFGEKPVLEDLGDMKRAIVALGKQDIDKKNIIPKDEKISIIGISSDHLILDLTRTKSNYQVGDIIKFSINYGGLLQLSTSRFVKKNFL